MRAKLAKARRSDVQQRSFNWPVLKRPSLAGYQAPNDIQTIGVARDPAEIDRLVALGEQFIRRQSKQYDLFPEDQTDNAARPPDGTD
jgi:hypothetical protein